MKAEEPNRDGHTKGDPTTVRWDGVVLLEVVQEFVIRVTQTDPLVIRMKLMGTGPPDARGE